MNALGIARVSSNAQAEEDRYSIPHQREQIVQYCAARGWGLLGIVEYVHSGGSNQRELMAILERARREHADVLVIWELDRLSRNIVSTLVFVDELRRHGIRCAFIANDIDLTTPEGELQLHLLSAFAHYFRAQLGRKVKGGQALRVRQGKAFGRTKFGYRLGTDGHLQVDPDEAQVVRTVYDWYTQEAVGMREIARRLNTMGLRTRGRAEWGVSSVRLLLRDSDTYSGALTYGKRHRTVRPDGRPGIVPGDDGYLTVRDAHEAILTPEVIAAAAHARAQRATLPARAAGSPHLLTGLLYCGRCGGRMQRASSSTGGRTWSYYVCSSYVRRGRCARNAVHQQDVESLVLDDLRSALADVDLTPIVSALLLSTQPTEHLQRSVAALQRQLHDIPAMLARAEEAMLHGVYTPDAFLQVRANLHARAALLTADVASKRAALTNVPTADDLVAAIRVLQRQNKLLPREPARLRALLWDTMERIEIVDGEVRICYRA